MTAKRKELLRFRRDLLEDFELYARVCLKIRTKKGTIEPLVLNKAQLEMLRIVNQQFEETGRIRVIILKGRQMGLSTAIGGFLYWRTSQREAKKAAVVTHHADSTSNLFSMTRRYHDNVPMAVQPSTRYNSSRSLVFDKLDSSYLVATAGGENIGRSETLNYSHLSEVAFWPTSTAEENLNGLLQAVPPADDTAVFIESTAKGVTGPFYRMWRDAVAGENGYIPIFLPWFWAEEYTSPVPQGFQRTPEEEALAEEYGLTDGQLMWRREKIVASGRDLFNQEYPCKAEDAFLTTGRPVFDPIQIRDFLEAAPDPIARFTIFQGQLEEDPHRGELVVYIPHDPGETYYIGADVGMGVRHDKSDSSVAQVLDSRKRQVAVWRGKVDPAYFAEILATLGEYYNYAKIGAENNSHGILTCYRLYSDLTYPNVYMDEIMDTAGTPETSKIGFRTTAKSRPMIIDALRAELREGHIRPVDKTTLQEMTTFIVTESGKLEHDTGCHDDTVMALAIANHIHEGVWQPLVTKPEWYHTGI